MPPFPDGPAIANELSPEAASGTPVVLYHYTSAEGLRAILAAGLLQPSTAARNPADARYGDGQYLTDIPPGTMTPAQLSARFIRNPYQGRRFTHYLAINVTGLTVLQGRPHVFVVPNSQALDLTGRLLASGPNAGGN